MAGATTLAHLVDRTRVPDPTLQRHAVAAVFRHLRSLPSPLPAAARDAVVSLLVSPSPSVSDQSARELCRLTPSHLPFAAALLDLVAALDGLTTTTAATATATAVVLVKSVAFVSRAAFRSDPSFRRFDGPHLHPFSKVLASGAKGVEVELARQAALFVVRCRAAEGIEAVVRFLRPFVMFAVLRKVSRGFARDLIVALAATATGSPAEAVPVLTLLVESLRHFPLDEEEAVQLWLNSAECLVDAYVVTLKELAHNEMPTSNAQASSVELMETLLSLCLVHHKLLGFSSLILELSKHLLVVQKELALNTNEPVCYLSEELLCVFPVINLVISPSKSVKAAASLVLSRFSQFLLDLSAAPFTMRSCDSIASLKSTPTSILSKLLHHLWSQPRSFSSSFFFMKYIISNDVSESTGTSLEAKCWTSHLREYLSTIGRQKFTLDDPSSENRPSGPIFLLLSSVSSILVMHPKLGTSAAKSLASLGATDPKLGMPILLVILFYSKILYSNEHSSTEILLRLLESLPSLALHSFMLPLTLQTISPMLQKEAKPVLHAIAVRLLCKIWITTDWAFPNLQGVLDPGTFSNFISDREISISFAASVRDVCKHNPDRGVDLILSISSCIESHDSVVQALGLEGLSYLCEADVVDFYTAWKVISKQLLNYSIDPTVAHGLCTLLRWGAMDAEAYSESSKNIIRILWGVATSKKHNSESMWGKARATAFYSLSHYKVSLIQDIFPDFKRRNYECFIKEDNPEVLRAMEDLEVEIIKFEHMTRRRVIKDRKTNVHKFEKLLDVFPQAVFSQEKSTPRDLPGAALLMLNFTPKGILREGTSKDLLKVHAVYEQALAEIAESLYVSRNLMVAALALQSWKLFMSHWMRAVVAVVDVTESNLDKSSKAANDIFKILCKFAPESIPRVAVNIAFAIGALCLVVPPTAHVVISAASDFLLKWLFEYEHEHQQWSAAITLGLISNCFHPTDKKRKFKVASGLLEVISKTESYLVKGACGLGLGYVCQVLLNRVGSAIDSDLEGATRFNESVLVEDIFRTLSALIVQFCPSTFDSFKNLKSFPLHSCGVSTSEVTEEKCDNLDDDSWAVAGLVLGLGNSVVALYRLGAYETVIEIKNMLVSWILDIDLPVHSPVSFGEINTIPLCIGSCLVLPAVVAFCQRVELWNDDVELLFNHYTSLALELVNLKESGALFQNLLMAICIGAGSLLSCILNDGVHSLRFSDVKCLLDIFKHIYTHPYPPIVHLGGMFGAVNAFGAGAGDLTLMCLRPMNLHINHEKESTYVRGPILANPVGETFAMSMIQEMFLMAKDAKNKQTRSSAAWAISFLRNRWLSKNFDHGNDSQNTPDDYNPSSQSFSNESLVWNLSLWLRDINTHKTGDMTQASTIATVLKCLSKAPRLPAVDWGVIIQQCMKHETHTSVQSSTEQDQKLLREECLCFSLAHASQFTPILHFLDDLTDLPRFRRLEINLQSTLLQHLSYFVKLFSGSRLAKLYEDLIMFFCSSVSPLLDYTPEQRSMLRMSFWKGLEKCLTEVSEESDGLSCIKRCIECLFCHLPVYDSGQCEFIEEWSSAINCLAMVQQRWSVDVVQVHSTHSVLGESHFDVEKKIVVKARLYRMGCGSARELGEIKTTILSTRTEGMWWNVLVEVAAAIYSTENSIKRQWLLDALEISCVTKYPSTALRFVGLLSGSCCIYMPLLVVNPMSVLSDLPVTLPSLLSSSDWGTIRSSAVDKFWSLTVRIYAWAEQSIHGESFVSHDHIDQSEAEIALFLARVMHSTCLAFKSYLPFDKQLRLANLEAL